MSVWCLSPDLVDAGTLPVPGVDVCGVLPALSDRSPKRITDVSLRRPEFCNAKQIHRIVNRDLLSHQLLSEDDIAESLVLVTGVASPTSRSMTSSLAPDYPTHRLHAFVSQHHCSAPETLHITLVLPCFALVPDRNAYPQSISSCAWRRGRRSAQWR